MRNLLQMFGLGSIIGYQATANDEEWKKCAKNASIDKKIG
jgi:hypothetical protein